ncbi:HEPN domain-containing protein [Photobacterium kishitanii]|uniref:ApeA N-terminal domain 1-containing protein n=1 Tax=Photobacterium kishitanii TaxID=318456 RepID=UPI0027397771|nr:HEPN domain-containing protein [Photobacterium kishitanii]
MSNNVYSAFEEHEFFGEFFLSTSTSQARFPAKIKYSPLNGLQLMYSISDFNVESSCARLYGILDNGSQCTLVGPFDFDTGTHRHYKVYTKSGIHGFAYLMIGSFLEESETFGNCRFTFHGMQEFFHPQGHISQVKFTNEILEKIEGVGWTINIENQATFKRLGDRILNLIHTTNSDAMIELDEAFKKIKERHPNAFFNLRNSLKYYFNFKKTSEQSSSSYIADANKISALFSILMNKPTFPEEIRLYSHEKPKEVIHVLSSLCLESRTIDLINRDTSFFFLPINRSKVDMSEVITKWLDCYDEYRVISVTHQYETGFRTLHSAYSDIILYSTQLESINRDLGGATGVKYANPIEFYGSPILVEILSASFAKYNNDSLGENISNLRNELAHVGRPKVLIHSLTIDEYVKIGSLLQLVVVSHLLSKIGFDQSLIHEYQDKLISEN